MPENRWRTAIHVRSVGLGVIPATPEGELIMSTSVLNPPAAEPVWLSRVDLARRYGVSVKTIAEWDQHRSGVPFAKIGKHIRYRMADVLAWEQARLAEAAR